jgi:hypothetical protein
MLRRLAFVRTDVSEELRASFIRVTRIGELGTTLAVTSNRRMQRAFYHFFIDFQRNPMASDVLTSMNFPERSRKLRLTTVRDPPR